MTVSAPAAPSWAEAANAVAEAVDVLADIPPLDLADAQLAGALHHAAAQAARLYAVAAGVVAEADARRTWRSEGASSLRSWVRRCVQLADDAARLVVAARTVPLMPKMAALFSAGRVSLAQISTAARQVRRLPDHPAWPHPDDSMAGPGNTGAAVDSESDPAVGAGIAATGIDLPACAGTGDGLGAPTEASAALETGNAANMSNHDAEPAAWGDVRAAADDILARYACTADARELAALGEHIYAAADPGGHLGDALSKHERRHLSISRGFESMGEIAGRLDPEATERVATVLDVLSERAGPDDHRTAGQRRADALDTLCTTWLESGQLPATKDGKTRRQVIVTIPYQTLIGLSGTSGATLGDGTPISAETARRLACDAAIRRVILGPSGSDRAPHLAASGSGRGPSGSDLPPSGSAMGPSGSDVGLSPPLRNVAAVNPTARLTAILRAAIAALPLPLDGRSAVLDAGRSTPTFTQPMRDALRARYGGRCSFSRCNRRATVDHHIIHWSAGGRTSVTNGAPLCDYHHYLVHEGGWRLRKDSDGNICVIAPPDTWPGVRRHWRGDRPIAGAPPDLRLTDQG